jgi:hypothetical protein
MPDDHVDVLDEDATVLRVRLDDTALLAAILAFHDLHGVAFAHLQRLCHLPTTFLDKSFAFTSLGHETSARGGETALSPERTHALAVARGKGGGP